MSPLSRVKVTIEAQTEDGALVVVSIPWEGAEPPRGVPPLSWVIAEASKRTRAALDAGAPKPATFGEAAQVRGSANGTPSPTFGPPA